MSYGLQKYPTAELRKEILAAVDAALQRSDAFGTSLSYYGMTCDFSLNIGLAGRQDDAPALISVSGSNAVELIPPTVAVQEVKSEGTLAVGKGKPRPREGTNTVSREFYQHEYQDAKGACVRCKYDPAKGKEPHPSCFPPVSPEQAVIEKERNRLAGAGIGSAASVHK